MVNSQLFTSVQLRVMLSGYPLIAVLFYSRVSCISAHGCKALAGVSGGGLVVVVSRCLDGWHPVEAVYLVLCC